MAKAKWIPLEAVPALLPKRARGPVSHATVRRWATYGLRGGKVKLRTHWIGSYRVTTEADIAQFVADLTAARRTEPQEIGCAGKADD